METDAFHEFREDLPQGKNKGWRNGVRLVIAGVLLAAVLVATLVNWIVWLAVALWLVLGIGFERLSWRRLLRALTHLAPALCLLVLPIFWSQQPAVAGRLTGVIVIKSVLATAIVWWLVETVGGMQILALLRRCRFPDLLLVTMLLLLRYLAVLGEESRRLQRARAARQPGRSTWRDWPTLGGILGMLLIRAAERAQRVHQALCARGWRGDAETLLP